MLSVGDKFGRWKIIGNRTWDGKSVLWKCLCVCGNTKMVYETHLKRGNSKSCGCLASEVAIKTNTTHNLSNHPIYKKWSGIKRRCYRKKEDNYYLYGKRGIFLCKRWHKFEKFYMDMIKDWKPGLQIDRKDNNKGYSPDNCRWVTPEQQQNNRRNNHLLTYKGKSMTISQWARKIGLSPNTLERRINKYGWTTEEAITTPLRGNRFK